MTTKHKAPAVDMGPNDQLILMRGAMKFALRSRHNLDPHFLASRANKMARTVPDLSREAVLTLMRVLLLEVIEESFAKAVTARVRDHHDDDDDDGFGHGGN